MPDISLFVMVFIVSTDQVIHRSELYVGISQRATTKQTATEALGVVADVRVSQTHTHASQGNNRREKECEREQAHTGHTHLAALDLSQYKGQGTVSVYLCSLRQDSLGTLQCDSSKTLGGTRLLCRGKAVSDMPLPCDNSQHSHSRRHMDLSQYEGQGTVSEHLFPPTRL